MTTSNPTATDVVERLRERGAAWMCELLEEAAGEIERLRHILAELNVTPDVAERLTYHQVLAEDRAEMLDEAAAEITRLREEVAELRKPPGETIGWSRETLAELMSARDQIASDRRCTSRDRCTARSTIFRCDCMQSAVWRRTSR